MLALALHSTGTAKDRQGLYGGGFSLSVIIGDDALGLELGDKLLSFETCSRASYVACGLGPACWGVLAAYAVGAGHVLGVTLGGKLASVGGSLLRCPKSIPNTGVATGGARRLGFRGRRGEGVGQSLMDKLGNGRRLATGSWAFAVWPARLRECVREGGRGVSHWYFVRLFGCDWLRRWCNKSR